MRTAPDKQRSERVVAHITKEEHRQFVAICDRVGISVSTGLRMLLVRALEEQQQKQRTKQPLKARSAQSDAALIRASSEILFGE